MRGAARAGVLAVLLALTLGFVGPVRLSAADDSSISGVQQALERNPVYVAPDAEAASLVDADALRRALGNAPIVVAVLPTAARNAVQGESVDGLPAAIGGRRAVVVLCGRSLRAAASSTVLPAGRAGDLARDAQQRHSGAFDRQNVQGALEDLVTALRKQIADGSSGSGSTGAGSAGSGASDSSSSGSAVPWLLAGLVVLGGGGAFMASRRRSKARRAAQQVDAERAEATSLYGRLASDVSTLDPGNDATARQAMADASERYTAAGALLSRASTSVDLAAARHTVAEGLHASRVARQRLGLDLGPPIPEPNTQSGVVLDRPQQVDVGGSSYAGYPSYAPGSPYYFPGGTVGGGYIPGGWYGSRFWEGALLGGLAGTVLTGGFGGFGGFGMGGYGYGSGYESGYDQGFDPGQESDNGGDWGGDGGGDWGGDSGGGGDWGGESGGGGGDW